MNLFKSDFWGIQLEEIIPQWDHTQNVKLPKNLISCNYKNKSKTNLPLISSLIPRLLWINGTQKRRLLKSVLPLNPDFDQAHNFQSPAECLAQWSRLTILASSLYQSSSELADAEISSLFSKYPPFLPFHSCSLQPLSLPWKKQYTE